MGPVQPGRLSEMPATERPHRNGRAPGLSDVVVVGVRQQREEASALDRGRQLALVACLRARDAARDDLAVLGNVLTEGVEILVIDLFDAFGGETAEFTAAEELGHVCDPRLVVAVAIVVVVATAAAIVATVVVVTATRTLLLVLFLALEDEGRLEVGFVAANHEV